MAVDLPTAEGIDPDCIADFKGNMNTAALREFIRETGAENIPLCMITVTNNSQGGQPVSMQNIRETKEICREHGIPLFLDACRFAENAYFIKLREPGYADRSVRSIVQEMFSYADGCTMSAKKDGIVNIGGFVAMNDDALAVQGPQPADYHRGLSHLRRSGRPRPGGHRHRARGSSGRELSALPHPLDRLSGRTDCPPGVPILQPPGGHAIYLNAKKFLPHVPPDQYPGQALSVELFRWAGIRSVEIGSVMFGKYDAAGKLIPASMELVRLAIPRRVYTQSHIDYVIEAIVEVFENRDKLRGYRIVEEPPMLRHFHGAVRAAERAVKRHTLLVALRK